MKYEICLCDWGIYLRLSNFLDTEGKLEKIDEFLHTIEERLQTLEEEKEELKEYQKWDKLRRSLEYCIHDRDLKDTKRKLEEVNTSLQSSSPLGFAWV